MGKSSSTPAPPTLADSINDVATGMPSLYGTSATYNPLFGGLNLSGMEQAMFGSPEQTVEVPSLATADGWYDADGNLLSSQPNAFDARSLAEGGDKFPAGLRWVTKGGRIGTTSQLQPARTGLVGLYGQAVPQLQGIQNSANSSARDAGVADVNRLAPGLRDAWRGANGQQAGLLDALNASASQQLALGSRLDPDTAAMLRNAVMGGASNRGWGYNPGDMGQVAMTTGQAGEALRQQRQGFASNVAGYNQAASIDPFAALLQMQGAGPGQAMNMLGQNAAGVSQNNPISGLLGYSQDNIMTGYNAAVSQANANANNDAATTSAALGATGLIAAALI